MSNPHQLPGCQQFRGGPAWQAQAQAQAQAQPETVTSCHTPPFRLRPLPLALPGAESPT